mgnify:CR=1 FL=1
MGVTTPCAGKIAKIDAQVKETYPVGAVLGYVEASEAGRGAIRKAGAASSRSGQVAAEIPGAMTKSKRRKPRTFPDR